MFAPEAASQRTGRPPSSRMCGLALGLLLVLVSPMVRAGAVERQGIQPAPRAEDGRFANAIGPLSHGSTRVRLSFLMRRLWNASADRSGAPERIANDGSSLRGAGPTVTWIGHATLLVQMNGVSFLTDPNWSERASPISWAGPKRLVAAGLALEDLPQIDFVLISHNHYDHLDLDSLVALAKRSPDTRFLVPLGNTELLRDNGIQNVAEFDWSESLEHMGLTIHCLPAQHWSKRGVTDTNQALWSSWAVTGADRRFYFAGDTGYSPHFRRIGAALGPFDLAAVPIGAYEPKLMMEASHMNPEEAMRAAVDLGARRAIGVHFGTFELTDEPLDEPPTRFAAAAGPSTLSTENTWIFKIGETRGF